MPRHTGTSPCQPTAWVWGHDLRSVLVFSQTTKRQMQLTTKQSGKRLFFFFCNSRDSSAYDSASIKNRVRREIWLCTPVWGGTAGIVKHQPIKSLPAAESCAPSWQTLSKDASPNLQDAASDISFFCLPFSSEVEWSSATKQKRLSVENLFQPKPFLLVA